LTTALGGQLAHNVPERMGSDLRPKIVARVASACDNFDGQLDLATKLKDAAPGRRPSVFMGRDHMIWPALKLGSAGAITVCSNVAPRPFVDLYAASRQGNLKECVRLLDPPTGRLNVASVARLRSGAYAECRLI
jgi:4-hydroxy-tetrahydrodipicolinate synthase